MFQKPSLAGALSMYFGAIFLFLGLHLPFFPLWLDAQGLQPSQVALVLAVPFVVRVLATPTLTAWADRARSTQKALGILGLGLAIVMTAHLITTDFIPILVATIVLTVFLSPILPVTDALAIQAVHANGIDYGRVRLWGSVTFIIANLGGGVLIAGQGPSMALFSMIGATWIIAISAWFLPLGMPVKAPSKHGTADPEVPKISETAETPDVPEIPEVARPKQPLWRLPGLLPVCIGTALLQASHMLLYGFGSIHWTSLGYSGGVIGLLWAWGVIAEVVLFALAGVTASFGLKRIRLYILLAGVAALVRWPLTALDLSLPGLFAVQTLHALTFGATHLATVQFLGLVAPEGRLSAVQGYSFTIHALTGGLAMTAAGPLYGAFGGGAFFVSAGIGVMGAVIALVTLTLQVPTHMPKRS